MLVTGASRGIGAEIALQYARAGAKLALVARGQANLEARRDTILREHPSAQIIVFSADVRDVMRAQEIVSATVAHFGRLDVLVANAAIIRPMDQRAFSPTMWYYCIPSNNRVMSPLAFASKDPKGWWDVLEVNIRGPYNFTQWVVVANARCPASRSPCTA